MNVIFTYHFISIKSQVVYLSSAVMLLRGGNSCNGTRGGSQEHAENQWQSAALCKADLLTSDWMWKRLRDSHYYRAGAKELARGGRGATAVRVPVRLCSCSLCFWFLWARAAWVCHSRAQRVCQRLVCLACLFKIERICYFLHNVIP